jgi:beta-lactamase class A
MKQHTPKDESPSYIGATQYYQPRRPSTSPDRPLTLPKRRSWQRMRIIASVVVCAILFFMFRGTVVTSYDAVVASIQSLTSKKSTTSPSVTDSSLVNSVNTIIKQNSQYQIGIALINIATGESQTFGTTGSFEAASTGKILTACAYYHLVETGGADLNDPMGNYTAQFQLQEMVKDSDNDSWQLIVDALGDKQLQAYATSIGINYDEPNNTLSPLAMATLLTKLYKGSLLNQADTQQLLGYMQNTNDETLIPAALPDSITVYHKYGLLDDELHDASILVDNGQAYSFVIYTKNKDGVITNDPRVDIFHQLTHIIVSSLFPDSYSQ